MYTSTTSKAPVLESLLDVRSEIRLKMQHDKCSFHLPEATEVEVLRQSLAANIKATHLLYPLSLVFAIMFIVVCLGSVLQAYNFSWWVSAIPGLLTFAFSLQTLLIRLRITHLQNTIFLLQLDQHLAHAERTAMFSHALS